MYKIGTIREWKTQNFHVIVDAVEETDLDLSWDEDGSTRKGLENGSLIAFCARARVFLRGMEIASDYLGGCIYKSLADFEDHRECAAYTRKLWRREGKFNIYRGPMRNGVVSNKDKLKARGFMTRERAERWARENAKEEYHITESAGCGSYFAGMVHEVIREARKELASLGEVKIRQVKEMKTWIDPEEYAVFQHVSDSRERQLEQWILNDEGLYNWARSERVDVDGSEDEEEDEKADSNSLWESEQEDKN